MGVPKSVVKFKRAGVEFVSNVDACQYTLRELTRAALRDVGKFLCKKYKEKYYKTFDKITGKAGIPCQYFVKTRVDPVSLSVGLKGGRIDGFYSRFQETGTSRQPRVGILEETTFENIDMIREIEGKYLSAINDNILPADMSEEDYKGSAEDA